MNKNDYIKEVGELHASDELKNKISQSAFDKPKKSVNRKKRIMTVIAACLAVAVIVTGVFAANPLSQTKQENNIEVGYDGSDDSISDSANGYGGTELFASDSSAYSAVSSDSRKIIKQASVNIETKNSEELIKKIINGQAPVFHSDRKAKAEVSGGGNESIGRQLYKHLMNGVSHMLPFVVAGGSAQLLSCIC